MANHPHKLARTEYVGKRTYFLTLNTHFRREIFREPAACRLVIEQFLRASRKHGFVAIAYTVMRDHFHALIEGTRDDSDFIKWIDLFKQLSAYYEKQRSGCQLWQEGYWDYIVLDDDATLEIASYIVWNPVEAKLVEAPEDYPFTGSERYSIAELADLAPLKPPMGGDLSGDG